MMCIGITESSRKKLGWSSNILGLMALIYNLNNAEINRDAL